MSELHGVVVGNMLKIRHAHRWTGQDLADRCPGFDRGVISKIENGHRQVTLRDLEVLAPALGVEPWQLLRPLTVNVVIEPTETARSGVGNSSGVPESGNTLPGAQNGTQRVSGASQPNRDPQEAT